MRCPHCHRRNPDGYLYCIHCGAPLGTASGEWRFATVVFFDLSGYSRFTRKYGAEVAWREASRAFALARAAIEKEGGEIYKTYGDGLIAIFGLGKSRGAEAERALRAAAATVAEVKARYRTGELKLLGRASVTSGLLLAMPTLAERELFGDPLNRAQRLVAAAPAGSVYLDETTQSLVHSAEVRALPPIAAKGFPEPLRAFAFVGFREKPVHAYEDALLQELERLWREAQGGQGRVGVLVGPLGSGKRLVLQAFLARHAQGKVLRMPSLRAEPSLRGWVRRFLEANPALKRRILELDLPPETRLAAQRALGLRPGRVEQDEAVRAVAELIQRLATEPWIVLIEGLHRAPPLLLRFLEHWQGAQGPVLFLGTARSGGYPKSLALRRLTPSEAERWLAARFPQSPPQNRRRAAELADGLPGLSIELLPAPSEERLLAALQPYFDALEEARETLFLASSLAEPIALESLTAILGPRARDHAEVLLQEGFLKREGGRLVFASAAYKRAAAASVPKAKRQAWLKSLAEAYLKEGAHEKAVRCYLEAGLHGAALRVLRALAQRAPGEEALRWLRQAEALAKTQEQRNAIRLDLAERLLVEAPDQALKKAEDLQTPRALRIQGLALAELGQTTEAAQLLAAYLRKNPEDLAAWQRFLEIAPLEALAAQPLPNDLNLRLLLAERLARAGQLEKAGAIYQRALAETRGDRAAQVALELAGLAWRRSRPRDALIYAKQALARAQSPPTAAYAQAILGSLELDVGHLEQALAYIEEARSALDGFPCNEAYARVAGVELRLLIETGRLDQAALEADYHLSRCAHPWIEAMATLIHALKGDAAKALAQAGAFLPHADSPHTEGFLVLARGLARATLGQDPRPDYRRALGLAKRAQNPYLRFLVLAAFALYHRPHAPGKTKTIADQMLRQTWRQGFLPFHHLARLLKAEAARAEGRRVAPLLRFESPFLVLEYWRRSLLLAEGHEVKPLPEERILGYGILGRLALASWKRVWTHAKRSGRESA